jgi:hypothetical protein
VDAVAFSPTNAWALATDGAEIVDDDQVFRLRWDGSRWRPAPAARRPVRGSFLLYALSGTSERDLWAVGESGADAKPLILHWNGRRLRAVPAPGANRLTDVVALTPQDAWAVGENLALHWDGRRWARVSAVPRDAELLAVAGQSSTRVWAVGFRSSTRRPVVVRWDGRRWRPVPTPSTPLAKEALADADVARDGTLWTVGETDSDPDRGEAGEQWATARRAMHAAMRLDPSPSLRRAGSLDAVVVRSGRDAWATGGRPPRMTFLHWDGRRWRTTMAPAATRREDGSVNALAAAPQGPVWAVGDVWDARHQQSRPLVLAYDC